MYKTVTYSWYHALSQIRGSEMWLFCPQSHRDAQCHPGGPGMDCSPALTSRPEPHDSKTISQTQMVVESVGWGGKSPKECSFALVL